MKGNLRVLRVKDSALDLRRARGKAGVEGRSIVAARRIGHEDSYPQRLAYIIQEIRVTSSKI